MKQGLSHFLVLLFLLFSGKLFSQTTLVFQPDAACGKDALVTSLLPDNNYATHKDFLACKWTNGGTPVAVRSFVSFNLSGIPMGTVITSATLELFHYNSISNIGHSTLSGPNDASIYRVTQPWDENTLTWNTQPTTTAINSLFVPVSSTTTEDYALNVTALVQDMINDPANSFGFMFRQNLEVHYRSMLFASSDMTNPAKHPKLTITLGAAVSIADPCVVVIEVPDLTIGSLSDLNLNIPTLEPSLNIPVETPPPVEPPGESTFYIPNAFTPEGNGWNEVFHAYGNYITDFNMKIFSRWGELVFEASSLQSGWDGSFRGNPVEAGVYVVKIFYKEGDSAEQKEYLGHVTVIR